MTLVSNKSVRVLNGMMVLLWGCNTVSDGAGLSKFAKLARSVTRSRSVLVSALPALKEPQRQSHLAHVSTTTTSTTTTTTTTTSTALSHVNTHTLLYLYLSYCLRYRSSPAVRR